VKFSVCFVFIFSLQTLFVGKASAEEEVFLKDDFRKALTVLIEKYSSGEVSRASEIWELRKVINQFDDLKSEYPDARLIEMLKKAADFGDPKANYFLVQESKEVVKTEQDLERLKIAHDGGINEASLLLAFSLAFEKKRFDAARKVVLEYLDRDNKAARVTGRDSLAARQIESEQQELLLEIVSGHVKITRKMNGEDIFSDARLASAWNSWRFPPLPQK
jgi:hypothetical protein